MVLQLPETGVVRIGAGLQQEGDRITAVKAGFLRQARGGKLWVEGRQRRYIPAAGDSVVGVIREKHSENFDVDVNGPFKALLPVLAFEGATRRNRPNLQVRWAAWLAGRLAGTAASLPREPNLHSPLTNLLPSLPPGGGRGLLPRGAGEPGHGADPELHGRGGEGAPGWPRLLSPRLPACWPAHGFSTRPHKVELTPMPWC